VRAAYVSLVAIAACGGGNPPTPQAPATPVSDSQPGDAPLAVEPPAVDAGAAPVDTPPAIDGGAAPSHAVGPAKPLPPTKVSWPKDRRPAQFHLLGGGTGASNALLVSADGSTPIGIASAGDEAPSPVRWRDGMMRALPSAFTGVNPAATSRNGDVVAGTALPVAGAPSYVPLVWRGDGAALALPLTDAMSNVQVRAVSRDGSTIVGCSGDDCGTLVRWTKDKPVLVEGPDGFWLGTHPMSDDGKVLAGHILGSRPEGVRVGPDREEPRFGAGSQLEGISDDGAVVVGHLAGEAMLWRGTSATRLGKLACFDRCTALAVSADGGRVVGNCVASTRPEGALGREVGFVWDKKHGLRSVPDALRKAGVKLPAGVHLASANDICGYGLTLVGHARHADGTSEAWMAILPR
jgi:uncharacterized membrane protein